jgi:hypothetical protein
MPQAQEAHASAFRADDGFRCLVCRGGAMTLISRRTHPEHGEPYELQTFACGECKAILTRSTDKDGNQVS